MPVSIATAKDPFRGEGTGPTQNQVPTRGRRKKGGLRTPQARVLQALMPPFPNDPPGEWPIFTRATLAAKIGVSALSDSVWRALYGLHKGRRDAHLGLIDLNLVEKMTVDVDGVIETNYRITTNGMRAYQAHVVAYGVIPPVKSRDRCLNNKYKKD